MSFFVLKWENNTYEVNIDSTTSPASLMQQVEQLTGVTVINQKILAKEGWKGILTNETKLTAVKPGQTTLTLIESAPEIIRAVKSCRSSCSSSSSSSSRSRSSSTTDSNRKYSQQGETKQNKKAKTTTMTTTSCEVGAYPSFFVQSERLPNEYKDKIGISKGSSQRMQTAHWVRIYACLGLSYADRLALRCMCRLFNEVEKILTLDEHRYKMLKPMPLFAIFPHPKYPTLNKLMDILNEEYAAVSDLIVWKECTAPGALVVGMGIRVKYIDNESSEDEHNDDDDDDEFLNATIQKANDDESFDVVFDGDLFGETRKNVPLNEIQIQNVSAHDLLYSI
jgi:hypothetical protein